MSDPFVAEIRIFAGNFAPTGWALCNGQLMPISQNTALFSLLGTTYGGDGKSTFALPNLQGSAPIAAGQGPGLPDYVLGEASGTDKVTLLATEIPAHSHLLQVQPTTADNNHPDPTLVLANAVGGGLYNDAASGTPAQMSFNMLGITGSSFPHNNMQPFLVMNFIIAMQGVFPSRN
jgi:microcystin-dependent protein